MFQKMQNVSRDAKRADMIDTKSAKFVSTSELGRRTGVSRITAWRICDRHRGFGVKAGGTFRIPIDHVERVLRGERPADIAREARNGR